MNKLNKMVEGDIDRTSKEIVIQSQKVDRLILEYMRECGDMKWMKNSKK
jgi:hypothetical protein